MLHRRIIYSGPSTVAAESLGQEGSNARKIVGWHVGTVAHVGLARVAVQRVLYDGRTAKGLGLVHRGDRGSQYLSILHVKRSAEAGIEP